MVLEILNSLLQGNPMPVYNITLFLKNKLNHLLFKTDGECKVNYM